MCFRRTAVKLEFAEQRLCVFKSESRLKGWHSSGAEKDCGGQYVTVDDSTLEVQRKSKNIKSMAMHHFVLTQLGI